MPPSHPSTAPFVALIATVQFMLPIRLAAFAGCVSVPGIVLLTIIVHHFANW
jgi:hypothetical protein